MPERLDMCRKAQKKQNGSAHQAKNGFLSQKARKMAKKALLVASNLLVLP